MYRNIQEKKEGFGSKDQYLYIFLFFVLCFLHRFLVDFILNSIVISTSLIYSYSFSFSNRFEHMMVKKSSTEKNRSKHSNNVIGRSKTKKRIILLMMISVLYLCLFSSLFSIKRSFCFVESKVEQSSSLESSSHQDIETSEVTLYKEGNYEVINGDKVFIATNEWQIVPQDVSIPPGLWIRMDISSGGRLARLLEEETVLSDDAKELVVSEEVRITNHEIKKEKENTIQFTNLDDIIPSATEEKTEVSKSEQISKFEKKKKHTRDTPNINKIIDPFSTQPKDNNTDPFTVMERVLLNLPVLEMEKMKHDLIAAKDSFTNGVLSKEEYFSILQYEWNERQELIRQSYESILDNAEVYKKHMQSMELFFNLPLSFSFLKPEAKVRQDSTFPSVPEYIKCLEKNIVVMEDLEDFLTDVDLAYEFYAVGGWTYLINMLAYNREMLTSYEQYEIKGEEVKQITISKESMNILEKLIELESLLILNVGHMVKHNIDYQNYAVENIPLFFKSHSPETIYNEEENSEFDIHKENELKTNAVSEIVFVLQNFLQNEAYLENCPITTQSLLQRTIFTISSVLYGNWELKRIVLDEMEGAKVLASYLDTSLNLYSNISNNSKIKILTLFSDLIVEESNKREDESDEKIISVRDNDDDVNKFVNIDKNSKIPTRNIGSLKSNDIRDIFCSAQIHLIRESLENSKESKKSLSISKLLNIIEKSLKNISIFYPGFCYNEEASMNCEREMLTLKELLNTKIFESLAAMKEKNSHLIDYIEEIYSQTQEVKKQLNL